MNIYVQHVENFWYETEKNLKQKGVSEFKIQVVRQSLINLIFDIVEGRITDHYKVDYEMRSRVEKLVN